MNKKLILLYKIITIILILTILCFIAKTIYDCITLANCDYCSAPWYTAILINTTIFIIPVLLEFFICLFLRNKIKKDV